MGYVIFFFPSNTGRSATRNNRGIAPERLTNPEDQYYKCCGTDILKLAPIVNMVGFLLAIFIAILSIIFVLKYTTVTDMDKRYDPSVIFLILFCLAYPLITSFPLLRLFIAAQKKNYSISEYWTLVLMMIIFADLLIGGWFIFSFVGDDCRYVDYRDAVHCNGINMDVPLKLTLEVRIFCTSIGVLYIALGIVRCYSLYFQMKIRKYYIHVISGEYAHPDSASPPSYQPVNESKSSNQLRKDGQTQTNAIISGFGCIYGNMEPEELLAKLCEEKPPAESHVDQEQA